MAAWRKASATPTTSNWCSTTTASFSTLRSPITLLPTALDVPRMDLAHTVTPSPLNPLGVKGAGEAGAIPVGPLFAQALEDALDLPRKGIELLEIPLSPESIVGVGKRPAQAGIQFGTRVVVSA